MKTKFILPFILLNLLAGVGSLVMFWQSNWDLIWLGSFCATFPLPFFLMVLSQAFGIVRTSRNLPMFQLISLAAVVSVAHQLYTYHASAVSSEYVALGLAIFGALSYQWYIRIFSPYDRKKSASIVKGQTLPELDLTRLDATKVSSTSFVGAKTLLVFFRANWCPFCMNQLKEVLGRANQLGKNGVQVKFISNQGIDNSSKLAKDLKLPSHFEILQDEDLKSAKTLGIQDMGGAPAGMPGYPADTVMATVIALDAQGKVLFGDETDNYRVRPHPDKFLNVFE